MGLLLSEGSEVGEIELCSIRRTERPRLGLPVLRSRGPGSHRLLPAPSFPPSCPLLAIGSKIGEPNGGAARCGSALPPRREVLRIKQLRMAPYEQPQVAEMMLRPVRIDKAPLLGADIGFAGSCQSGRRNPGLDLCDVTQRARLALI